MIDMKWDSTWISINNSCATDSHGHPVVRYDEKSGVNRLEALSTLCNWARFIALLLQPSGTG